MEKGYVVNRVAMNLYKRIIPKKLRFRILRFLAFVPDGMMLQLQYWIKLKRRLNLKSPQRYTEKIQWYKLNYHNPIMSICVDKYRVREYLHSKNLDNIAVKLYGVYDSVEQIEWNKLPTKFIIKTTNGSGTNIICKDSSKLNRKDVCRKLHTFFQQSSASAGREWPYAQIRPQIIIEELLENTSSEESGISDYKILCFNGKPQYIIYDVDRFVSHKRNIYSLEWKNLYIETDCPGIKRKIEPPQNLAEMLKIAEILSADFPAVRVDLYLVNGKIYFGELTFYPWSGYVQFKPDSFDFELGIKFDLVKMCCVGGGNL